MFLFDIFAASNTIHLSIVELKSIGAGLAVLGMSGAGVGIGIVFAHFLEAFSKRPELKKELFIYAILGFALTESVALFCLSMTFVILNS
jgi:F-type H+-transporting ATPase subunit c